MKVVKKMILDCFDSERQLGFSHRPFQSVLTIEISPIFPNLMARSFCANGASREKSGARALHTHLLSARGMTLGSGVALSLLPSSVVSRAH